MEIVLLQILISRVNKNICILNKVKRNTFFLLEIELLPMPTCHSNTANRTYNLFKYTPIVNSLFEAEFVDIFEMARELRTYAE